MHVKKTQEKLKIYLMTLPSFVIYTLLLVIPIFMACYFALHKWNGIQGSPLEYVGFKNFTQLISSEMFHTSLINLVKLVVFSVMFHTPIALILAVALNSKLKGTRFFKVIFFVPAIFPLTAIGLLWYFIMMPDGALNTLLMNVGLENLVRGWLIDPKSAIPAVIFVNIWAGIGNFMIILLAGLKTIPEEIYESARMDGANTVQQFFNITIPMLKPIISMCILIDIIGTIKVFDLIFVMTEGGPNGLTNVPTTLMYYESFRYDNYGVGSALGIIILIITIVMTLLSQIITKKNAKGGVN